MHQTLQQISEKIPLKQNISHSTKDASSHFSSDNFGFDNETIIFRKSIQKTQVIEKISINREELCQFLSVSRWRARQSNHIIPINKIMIDADPQNQEKVLIKSFRDTYSKRIKDIELVNFSDLVIILEKVVCGFKLLEQRFGNFNITQNIIAIDKKNTCKVWFHQNFCQYKYDENYEGWDKSKYKLLNRFKNICLSSVLALQFFRYLKQANSFTDLLKSILIFKRENRLHSEDEKPFPVMKVFVSTELHFSGKQKKRLKRSQNLISSQRNIFEVEQNSKKLEYSVQIRGKCKNKNYLTSNSTNDQPPLEHKKFESRQVGSVKSSTSSLCSEFNISLKNPMLTKFKNTIDHQVYNHKINPHDEKEQKASKPKITLDSFCRVVDEKEESFCSDENFHHDEEEERINFNIEDQIQVVQIRKQCEKIIQQNGWSRKVLGLLDKDPILQQSINEGCQIQKNNLLNIKLNKLGKLGTSIISNPESQNQ